mmetsp:Transcript_2349/g.7497  ORF Transcript_2349/g.7497 Transcript_2349/m.7497 type:complete len:218 (-) Transcript_2349:272-925(-)
MFPHHRRGLQEAEVRQQQVELVVLLEHRVEVVVAKEDHHFTVLEMRLELFHAGVRELRGGIGPETMNFDHFTDVGHRCTTIVARTKVEIHWLTGSVHLDHLVKKLVVAEWHNVLVGRIGFGDDPTVNQVQRQQIEEHTTGGELKVIHLVKVEVHVETELETVQTIDSVPEILLIVGTMFHWQVFGHAALQTVHHHTDQLFASDGLLIFLWQLYTSFQ